MTNHLTLKIGKLSALVQCNCVSPEKQSFLPAETPSMRRTQCIAEGSEIEESYARTRERLQELGVAWLRKEDFSPTTGGTGFCQQPE